MSLVEIENSAIHSGPEKTSVRTFFDHDSNWKGEVYTKNSDVHARGVQRRVGYVMHMLSGLRGLRRGVALDAGCGPGIYLIELARLGFRCIGVDLSGEMVHICRQRLHNESIPDARILNGDIENLPLDSGTIDLLLCIGVLQYVDSPTRALEEIDRVTKPGGLVVVCFENLTSLSNLDWVIRQKCKSSWKGSGTSDDGLSMISQWFLNRPGASHRYRLYNPAKFEALMADTGFQMVDAMTYGYEFRLIRRLGIVSESVLNSVELFLERFFRRIRIPYFHRSGEFYIGVYEKSDPGMSKTMLPKQSHGVKSTLVPTLDGLCDAVACNQSTALCDNSMREES